MANGGRIDFTVGYKLDKTGLNEMDYFSNPTIQSALECGFSLEDAIMAWTIYGDNSDLVMQYLLSNNLVLN